MLVATPAEGWHFVNWTEGGPRSPPRRPGPSPPRLPGISPPISPSIPSRSTPRPTGNGTVTPATQTVDWGTDASIDITPDAHYHIATITDNGAAVAVSNPYVITDVREAHDVVATFAPDTDTWYLAEGCTGGGFETWVLVAEPQRTTPVTVDITFADRRRALSHRPPCRDTSWPAIPASPSTPGRLLHHLRRLHHGLGHRRRDRGASGPCTATAAPGPPTPSAPSTPASTWYLAEGCTGGGFETWVLVQNPGDTDGHRGPDFMLTWHERLESYPESPYRASPAWSFRLTLEGPSTYRITRLRRLHPGDFLGRRRGLRARHVRQRPHLGPRLHRHHRSRRHLVPGRGLHRRGLRDLGAGAEPGSCCRHRAT